MYLNRNRISFFYGICGTLLLSLLFFLSGCVHEDYSEGDDTSMGVLRFVLSADASHAISTRSLDESTINDLYLLVYDASHQLLKKEYYTSPLASPSDLILSVRSGSGYTIYGVANTGNEHLFSDVSSINTEDELKAFTTTLSAWNGIGSDSYMLMSGSVTGVTVLTSSSDSFSPTSTCNLSLKRLAAKVTLNVGIASGSGVTISGYHIYGLPNKSYYIAHPLDTESDAIDTQATRAEDASLPATASDWTDSGNLPLSNVTSFNTTFYMYENRAGVNGAITAQKNKVKANVPGTPADSAAYVIIYGKASGYSSLSWKIYLGANNTTNFNIKRNNQYTCTITLKANDADTRITYKKSGTVWAGSNIYWDSTNQRLTFDTETSDTNNKKQGVCFQWGSLIGVSISSTYVTYTPTYNSTTPSSSTWTQGSTAWGVFYITDEGSNYGQTNTFLNDAAQNADANYAAYKGDICQYLSKTQPSLGSWRMPTDREFDSTNFGDATTANPGPWTWWGTGWPNSSQTSPANDGQTAILTGATITVDGATTSYPASGCRNPFGTLLYVGQGGGYWSSSAYSSTYGYYLSFDSGRVYPARSYVRQYGFAVRCVQN